MTPWLVFGRVGDDEWVPNYVRWTAAGRGYFRGRGGLLMSRQFEGDFEFAANAAEPVYDLGVERDAVF